MSPCVENKHAYFATVRAAIVMAQPLQDFDDRGFSTSPYTFKRDSLPTSFCSHHLKYSLRYWSVRTKFIVGDGLII